VIENSMRVPNAPLSIDEIVDKLAGEYSGALQVLGEFEQDRNDELVAHGMVQPATTHVEMRER
jgi:hypothetical protein